MAYHRANQPRGFVRARIVQRQPTEVSSNITEIRGPVFFTIRSRDGFHHQQVPPMFHPGMTSTALDQLSIKISIILHGSSFFVIEKMHDHWVVRKELKMGTIRNFSCLV